MAVMRSTPLLIEAHSLDEYAVHVKFEDGTAADVDLSYLLDYGGVFEPLREKAYFACVHANAEAGTIVWPKTGADIAPRRFTRTPGGRPSALHEQTGDAADPCPRQESNRLIGVRCRDGAASRAHCRFWSRAIPDDMVGFGWV